MIAIFPPRHIHNIPNCICLFIFVCKLLLPITLYAQSDDEVERIECGQRKTLGFGFGDTESGSNTDIKKEQAINRAKSDCVERITRGYETYAQEYFPASCRRDCWFWEDGCKLSYHAEVLGDPVFSGLHCKEIRYRRNQPPYRTESEAIFANIANLVIRKEWECTVNCTLDTALTARCSTCAGDFCLMFDTDEEELCIEQ